MAIRIRATAPGLVNFVNAGRIATDEVKKTMRAVLNVGRTTLRQEIAAQFRVRTGRLRADARKTQTRVSIKRSEIKGQITPLPRLLNVFEGGAVLAYGRGILEPRPVIRPASKAMEAMANQEFTAMLGRVKREMGMPS